MGSRYVAQHDLRGLRFFHGHMTSKNGRIAVWRDTMDVRRVSGNEQQTV